MRKIITSTAVLLLLAVMFLSTSLNAQQTVTKTVGTGGDYATLLTALQAACSATANPVLVAGDNIVLNVVAGTLLETPNKFINASGGGNIVLRVPLNITIAGAGAEQTIIQGVYPTTNCRLWQWGDATTNLANTSFTFKDLTLKNWGSAGTKASGANGGIFNLSSTPLAGPVKFAYKNVIFSDCRGMSLINIGPAAFEVEIDNCLFKNNTLAPSTGDSPLGIMSGILNKAIGGNLTVKNTTFISNTFLPGGTASSKGALVTYSPATTQAGALVLENNVAVNNQFEAAASDATHQGMVFINVPGTPGAVSVTMNNNILIGNKRPGKALDVDVYFDSLVYTLPTGSGNIVNEAVEKLGDGTIVPYSYPRITAAGFKISNAYTYEDPRIAFVMDGALPKLTNDAFGIGHTSHAGDGGTPNKVALKEASGLRVFSVNQSIQIEGINAGTGIEVYNIMGSLIKKTVSTSDKAEVEVSDKGIFIVKAGKQAQKVIVY